MKMTSTKVLLPATLALLFFSCSKGEQTREQTTIMAEATEATVEVDTVTVYTTAFKSDIMSNGRIKATEVAEVYFRSSDLISDVMVHNGQRVRKGEPLARLDMFRLNSELTRQEAAWARAQLDLKDALIGQGYDPEDTQSIPEDVMNLARVRSGIAQTETSLNAAREDIKRATLTAPIDGVVANVKGARHTMASGSEPFCRIINDNVMSVSFPILESEYAQLRTGESVEVTPYSSNDKYHGTITEINPMVDESGHIAVKATLTATDSGRKLIDGENVRIRCSHTLDNRLIVPKSAVVLRTGRQVLFTYEDGKAIWHYVTTGLENLDCYEITDGLNDGATVIYAGNENLAHETPVTIAPSTPK